MKIEPGTWNQSRHTDAPPTGDVADAPPTGDGERYINHDAAAAIVKRSRRTLTKLASTGKIRAVKVRGRGGKHGFNWMYAKSDIERFALITSPAVDNTASEDWVSVEEAAKITGICAHTLYKMVRRKSVPKRESNRRDARFLVSLRHVQKYATSPKYIALSAASKKRIATMVARAGAGPAKPNHPAKAAKPGRDDGADALVAAIRKIIYVEVARVMDEVRQDVANEIRSGFARTMMKAWS